MVAPGQRRAACRSWRFDRVEPLGVLGTSGNTARPHRRRSCQRPHPRGAPIPNRSPGSGLTRHATGPPTKGTVMNVNPKLGRALRLAGRITAGTALTAVTLGSVLVAG